MPKAYFDRDTITLQEGNHIGAQIGGKMIKPDGMELVTGEVERVIIYRSPENAVELNCTRDVQFLPGEQVIFQPLGKPFRIGARESFIDQGPRPG